MLNVSRLLLAGAAGLTLMALAPTPSFAVGDEPARPKKCSQFKDGSAGWKKCMGTKLTDDVDSYSVGYWMAKTGDYATALDLLRSVKNQSDPRVQTMIGFALRRLGHVDEAMAYYTAALATDPNRTSTRQYLGEAFLQKGDRSAALGQLGEIGQRCGTTSEHYRQLADAIAKTG